MRRSKPTIGLIALATCLLSAGAAFAQDEPRLEIPVPGVEFSPIIKTNEYVTIPWLAQYIGGVYQFLISIVGLVAAVVMIVGGFQYLTSAGDKGRIGAAKKRITGALVGMILAFGSYTILYAINPDLVAFEGLQVLGVRTERFAAGVETQMGTTTSNTALGESPSNPPPVPGELKYEATSCPFQYAASSKEEGARKKEFIEKIQPFITKTDMRERIVQVAQYADLCDPVLGSCGTTVGTIIAIAYKGNASFASMSQKSSSRNVDCLDPNLPAGKGADGRFNCNGFRLGSVFEVGSELRREQYGRNCTIDQVKENRVEREKLIGAGKLKPDEYLTYSGVRCNDTECTSNGVKIPRSPCAATSADATREYVEIVNKAGLKGYPDVQADLLRPGDYVNIYNGNTDLTGGHAILFMGWAPDGIHAYVVQGGNGCARNIYGQMECRVARPGKVCLKKACGAAIKPITSIYRVL